MGKDLLTLYMAGNCTQKQPECLVPALSPSLGHRSCDTALPSVVSPPTSETGRRDTGSNVHPFYY